MAKQILLTDDGLTLIKDNNKRTVINPNTGSADRYITLPDASGTVALTSDIAGPLFSAQSANQSVDNSTVLVDSEIVLSLEASSAYLIEAKLQFQNPLYTAFSIAPKCLLVGPAGAAGEFDLVEAYWYVGNYYNTGGQSQFGFRLQDEFYSNISLNDANKIACMTVRGLLRTSVTAGTLKLQFAQETARTDELRLRADSYMTATKVA